MGIVNTSSTSRYFTWHQESCSDKEWIDHNSIIQLVQQSVHQHQLMMQMKNHSNVATELWYLFYDFVCTELLPKLMPFITSFVKLCFLCSCQVEMHGISQDRPKHLSQKSCFCLFKTLCCFAASFRRSLHTTSAANRCHYCHYQVCGVTSSSL